MRGKTETYEGFCSDEGELLKFSKAVKFEVNDKHQPIDILRIRRIYNKVPENFWFKSPKKIKRYIPVRIIVEYL